MYHLQSGDTVVLEGRLDEVTSFLHKRFKKLEDELATVKIHPDENIEMHEINQKQFREISENLTKLEKYDRQIYANILDIFRLRLYMIRLQREEAEDRELLTNDYELYNQKSKKALDEFNITIKNLQKQFEYDLTRCKSMYNRQINESKERLNKLNSSEIEKNIEKEIEKLYKKLHLYKKR
jgi:septal ring factor EnvC (AmiA/AmiB activator)